MYAVQQSICWNAKSTHRVCIQVPHHFPLVKTNGIVDYCQRVYRQAVLAQSSWIHNPDRPNTTLLSLIKLDRISTSKRRVQHSLATKGFDFSLPSDEEAHRGKHKDACFCPPRLTPSRGNDHKSIYSQPKSLRLVFRANVNLLCKTQILWIWNVGNIHNPIIPRSLLN